MLLRILEENLPLDYVVFYNTGVEFSCIYMLRDRMKLILKEKNIEFVELQPREDFMYTMLERPVKYRNKDGYHYGYEWCGGCTRWGTREKIIAIKKFQNSIGDEIINYVGIAADESDRLEKEKCDFKVFPLVEWGMTESDCLQYCLDRGWNWLEPSRSGYVNLYDILSRVSCWCCANKNIKELRNIYRDLPEYWTRLEELQNKIQRPFKGYYKSRPVGIFDLKERFDSENEFR